MVNSLDDIDRKSRKRERDRIKKEATEDISDVVEGVVQRVEDFFKRKQIKKQLKENSHGLLKKSVELAWASGLILLLINFVLANIWLTKTIIKSLISK